MILCINILVWHRYMKLLCKFIFWWQFILKYMYTQATVRWIAFKGTLALKNMICTKNKTYWLKVKLCLVLIIQYLLFMRSFKYQNSQHSECTHTVFSLPCKIPNTVFLLITFPFKLINGDWVMLKESFGTFKLLQPFHGFIFRFCGKMYL